MTKKIKIGIITSPISSCGLTPLCNLIEILYPISQSILLITGDAGYNFHKNNRKVKTIMITHYVTNFFLTRIFRYLLVQLKISSKIFHNCIDRDILFFFIGGDTLILPSIISKLLKKDIFLIITGSSIKTLKTKKDILYLGLIICRFFTCLFSTKIILYSECLINDYALNKWEKKIVIAHEHFVDFHTFTINTQYSDRFFYIGYIGRLSEEKGVKNFVLALSEVLTDLKDLKIIIVGEGQLSEEIKFLINKKNLNHRVELIGFISHENIPNYLNQLRLLVVPSYTEGLPNIILEAMACGTPVLATSVGSIADIVKDGITGFIMDNNSPKCIEMNIYRVLDYPNIEEVVKNGKKYVETEFQFKNNVVKWQKILEDSV